MRGVVWNGEAMVLVDDLEVRPPGPGEVTVRVLASGICHSDLNIGTTSHAPPVVPGHEAAGVVDEVGPGVDDVAVGDEVVIAAVTSGRGEQPFTWRGQPARSFAGVSSFAERTTVNVDQLVPRTGLPPAPAALVGCAASTGWGVVNNVVGVRAGQRVAVIGVGGIGVNAIAAARAAGAEVWAVDIDTTKEDAARHFGADRFSATLDEDVDVVIECSGAPVAIELALDRTAPNGTTALVGLPARGHRATFDVHRLMAGRRIVGSYNGDVTRDDLAHLVELATTGQLDLAGQVTRVWPLAEFHDALDALHRGEVVRAVLDLT